MIKKSNFPVIALIIGALLLAILMNIESVEGEFSAPLLMLLFMSELGFFVTGAGAFIGVQLQLNQGFNVKLALWTLGCSVLAIVLALRGFELWEYIS
ncbi:hypothetical protein [Kaarinaea lacus]